MTDPRLSAVAAVAILAAAAVAAVVSLPVAFAIVAAFLLAAAATTWPSAAMVVGAAAVALVPTYWVPDLPGTRVGLFPIAIVCLVLAPAALRLARELRVTTTDKVVAAFVVLNAVSYLVNASGRVGSILALGFSTALPYAVFRLLGLRRDASSFVAVGLVFAGVVSAYVAVREYNGWPNPFFDYFKAGHQHAFFARPDFRLGHPRPEAAFGHAIALGMFLVLAALLALGLAWRQRGGSRPMRLVAYGAAGAIVFALTYNLVRGPLVMLGFAVVLLVLTESRRGRHSRVVFVGLAVVALANTGSFANILQLRDASFETGGRVQQSGAYRVEIWRTVSRADNFSLVGKDVVGDESIGFVEAAGQGVGIGSFDNAYALIYIGFGALALAAFVLIGLRVAHAALFAQMAVIDHAWAAAILAAFVNLATVNLLTQFSHIFWLGIGLIAAAQQRAVPDERSPDPQDARAVAHA